MLRSKVARALKRPAKENLQRFRDYTGVWLRNISHTVRRIYINYTSVGVLCHLATRILALVIKPITLYRILGIWPFSPISYDQFKVWGKLDPPVSAYLKSQPKSNNPDNLPWQPIGGRKSGKTYGHIAEVTKGIALSNGVTLDQKGHTILHSPKSSFENQLEQLGPLVTKPWRAKLELKHFSGVVLVLSNSQLNNYYHFIFDAVGRMALVEDEMDLYQAIYVRKEMPYQQRYLSMLGLDNKQIISADQPMPSGITADRLVIPCFRRVEDYLIDPKITDYLRRNLLSYADRTLSQGERIYISRRKARYRRILNEPELLPVLAEYGFSVVYLEDYSVDKQISVFKFAKIVVSPHGTGLDNLLYCDPGTEVLEIFPSNNVEADIYFILAASLKLEYSYLTAIRENDTNGKRNADMIVKPDLFRKQLELLCAS